MIHSVGNYSQSDDTDPSVNLAWHCLDNFFNSIMTDNVSNLCPVIIKNNIFCPETPENRGESLCGRDFLLKTT